MPKYLLFLVALLWTGVILYFCLIKSSELPTVEIPNIDKCVHAFFYLVFTFVWFLFFQKYFHGNTIARSLLYSFLFSFVFGISIEVMQELFTTTRSADVFDVMANMTGATLSVIAILICNKFNLLKSILK